MSMDISRTVEPRSDQLNFDDVATSSVVITITEVRKGTAEQPVELHSAEFPGRPYKPGKSMRRVLIAAWGSDASVYVGRRVQLYGDPAIRFGKDVTGGIRIRSLSDIGTPVSVTLTVTRGKRAPFIVQPLPDAAPAPAPQATIDGALKAIHNAPDTAALDAIETKANQLGIGEHVTAAINKRRAELEGEK